MGIHDLKTIRGAGGGGSKKGGGASNADNTLRSKARARFIEIISEGEIEGLIDTLGGGTSKEKREKSIYFGNTRLRNPGGSLNFENVVWHEHTGKADEGSFKGQNAVETPFEVNVPVKKDVGPVVRTVTNENVDAVRVIARIDSLYRIDDDNGRMKTNSITYAIDVRSYNSNWVEVTRNVLEKQKCTTPVQFAHRVELPEDGAPWDIRLRKVTDDSNDDNRQANLTFDGYVELIEGKFIYPHCAAVSMEVNAEDMGSSIPARSYLVRGLRIRVPNNYDPIARTYEGIWNGGFKTAWTNNPAWIFYDLITNDRYGLGEFVPDAIVDKWGLYTIAQYCDQKIPSGFKDADTGVETKEPRFTYNGVIKTREDAFQVLQQITTAWRGMAYWSMGQVFATADMPADPVKLVSPANVIDGEFSYSSTALKARHSVILVRYNDPNDFYRTTTEVVINQEMLNRYGWREKTLVLNGCTSRGLAHRYGKWILDIEQNETETVEYAASWDHADVKPGDIIAVADPRKALVRTAGRIVSHSGTNLITLDAPFTPKAGAIYDLMLTLPDGSIEKKRVSAFVAPNQVRVNGFTQVGEANAMYVITGTDVVPRQYRVISLEEAEENIFRVTALFHDPQKYARIERNIRFDPLPYSRKPDALPPTSLAVRESSYVTSGRRHARLTLSWAPPQGVVVRNFVVSCDTPNDGNISVGTTTNFSIDMDSAGAGDYRFYVRTIDFTGKMSRPATIDYTVAGDATAGEGFPVGKVVNFELAENPGGTTFKGRDVRLRWTNLFPTSSNPSVPGYQPNDKNSPLYKNNLLKVYRVDTGELLRSVEINGTSYTYSFQANAEDNVRIGKSSATRALRFEIVATDVYERTTEDAQLTVTNPQPAMFNPNVVVNGQTLFIDWRPPTDEDLVGSLIWVSTTSGFDPYTTAPAFDGTGSAFAFNAQPETTYFVRAAAYDAFGKADLAISPEVQVRTRSAFDDVPPAIPTGLAVTSSILSDGKALMVATWNANTESDLAYYDINIKEGSGNYVSFQTSTNRYEWTVFAGSSFTLKVRAADRVYNVSGFSAELQHTAAKDTIPPAVPTGLSVVGTFEATVLKWASNTERDFAFYEIYEATTTAAPVANTAATFRSVVEGATRSGLPAGTTFNYWIRAVDSSGNRSAWSPRVSAATLTLEGTQPAPAVPAAPTVTSSIEVQPGGGALARVRVTVEAVENAVAYEVSITRQGAAEVIAPMAGLTYDFLAFPNIDHSIRVRSVSALGVKSAFGSTLVFKPARDTVPPAPATITKILAGVDSMWLTFSANADADFAFYEILEGSSDDPLSAEIAGTSRGNSFVRSGLPNTAQRFYWVRTVDTSGNKSTLSESANATTGSLPTPDKLTTEGLVFTADPVTNTLTWTAGSISYGPTGQMPVTESIDAGAAPYADFNATVYVYYGKGNTALSVTTNLATLYSSPAYVLLGIYKGGSDFQLGEGKVITDGSSILAGTIGAQQLVTNAAVITGAAQIASAIIGDAHITSLSAAKLTAGSAIAGSVTVAGTALSTINDNAALGAQNPASRINAGVTQIDPGKVVISGATTLANWRGQSDTTKIFGGSIETNTITARQIVLGDTSNMVDNGWSEGKLEGWTTQGQQNFYRATDQGDANGWILQSVGRDQAISQQFDVNPGETYYFEAWVHNTDAARANLVVRVSSPSQLSLAVVNHTDQKNQWVKLRGQYVVPAGYNYLAVYLQTDRTNGQGTSTYWSKPIMRRAMSGELIVDGAVTAAKINVTDLAVNGLANINTAYIKEANITGTISAAKLTAGTVLADGILIGGNSGQTIGDLQTWATNPAARVNAAGTKIDPGLITVSGATTLANWRNGSDTTKIEGGSIAANTISANSLKIGSRGLTVVGFDFRVENGVLVWGGGNVSYTGENGALVNVQVAAGSVGWGGWTGIYFQKENPNLHVRNDSNGGWNSLATNDTCVLFCSWWGGTSLNINYGGTIIDGSRIVTGTVTANQIGANQISGGHLKIDTIEANHLRVNSVNVDKIVMGNITYDKLGQRAAGYIKVVETTGQVFNISTVFQQRLTIDITKGAADSLIIDATFRARCTNLGGAASASVQFRLKEYLNGAYQGDIEYNKVFFNDTSSAADDVMTCMIKHIKNGGEGNYTYAIEIKKNTSGSNFVIGATKMAATLGSKQA